MSEDVPEYDLWLEFEMWVDDALKPDKDFFNMGLELADGRQYAFNVWTYGIFATIVDDTKKNGENLHGLYLQPPDLFVRTMDRPTCERVVEDMIANNTLPEHCRCHESDDWDDWENWHSRPAPIIRPQAQLPPNIETATAYTLHWRGRFRLNRASKIDRMVNWLSRELGCALTVVDFSANEGCFDVLMQSHMDSANATSVFWMANQFIARLGEHHVNGPTINGDRWQFELVNTNPRNVPSLEWISVQVDNTTVNQ